MTLKDKVAVVAGGASGIGRACAEALAEQGAKVAVLDFNIEAGRDLEKKLKAKGYAVTAWKADVANKEEVMRDAEEIFAQFGKIDIWINCAGVSVIIPFLEHTEEIWDRTLDINLKGQFFCCQAAVTYMMKNNQGGSIINFSSQSGKKGTNCYAAYCASKFGVIGLTQSVAMEFASSNIRCNAVCPGVVQTPMWDRQAKDYAKKKGIKEEEVMPRFCENIPLGRLCSFEDVTQLVLFLADQKSGYMTGQSFNLTGGSCMY
ncbi:SDR family NAD(P)-dependent oxidoreductase [Anaerostipes sp.]|uniref:SDR family NAD(P)-dependent oxidoreductase n=1 Tax=Anaerostipes sp. TaxID=1872530 RepID=UPI0025BDBBF5|nr:SDR family oxidoreductase [Anaerostipes sp.]MBS7007430.1 SDR family oxidoreductase [Anaerostipes sp.]